MENVKRSFPVCPSSDRIGDGEGAALSPWPPALGPFSSSLPATAPIAQPLQRHPLVLSSAEGLPLPVTPAMRRQVAFLRKVFPARQALEGSVSPAEPRFRIFGGLLLGLPGPRRASKAASSP